jgi:DNA (cytosine-5)-methyltransferase 1
MTRPIGIDLFAGAGGMSLGFEQAGFDVVAAVEIDPIHAAVHAYNFPNCTVLPQSVSSLTAADIRDAANIGQRRVDIVFGGAPCQGFSMIGQRALDDPRNSLVKDFVRLVVDLDASYFVFENVKGITVGRHASFLAELIEEFQQRGYEIVLPWKVLNAAHYGVPQKRERLILIGAKKGLQLPAYPAPITRAAGSNHPLEMDLPQGPSCQDALGDIPDAEEYPELLDADATPVKWGRPSAYAKTLRGMVEGSDYFGYTRSWSKGTLTSSLRTNHSEISRGRFASTAMGDVEPTSRFFKLPASGVSNTLRAGTDSARGAFTSPRPIHYKYPRCITVREMLRLHGFPDWFRTHVTKWHGARQVGNAVPPPLARAVASSILEAGGWKPTPPPEKLVLGNEQLLSMDMGQAARHFEINIPIKQRDRKGTPKPRQKAAQPA